MSGDGRRGGAWLAGWLFADLFLVLFVVFLADGARSAAPDSTTTTAPKQTQEQPGSKDTNGNEPLTVTTTQPSAPPGLDPTSISKTWDGGQLEPFLAKADTDQPSRDRMRDAFKTWFDNSAIKGNRIGIVLIFTKREGTDTSWSETVAGILCEQFEEQLDVPPGLTGTGLQRCGSAAGRIRTYFKGGNTLPSGERVPADKGDLEIELWVYQGTG